MSAFASTLAPALASTLVAAAWQSALLALAVALCLRLLPGLSARLRSVLWLVALLAMLLLPFAPLLRSAPPSPSSHLRLQTAWALVLVGAWAVASLIFAVRLLLSALHLYGIVTRAHTVIPSTDLALILRGHSGETSVQLCTSTEVDVPSVAGFFRPRILLPPALFAEFSPADLRQIILHELQHLRRHDDWTNLLQKLAVVLFPLNPALLWVERRLCLERELACDDGVLQAAGTGVASAKAYATCLVNLAEHGLLRRTLSLALGAFQRPSELSRRVHRILRGAQRSTPRPAHPAALIACLLAATCTISLLSARAPELIGFGGANVSAIAQAGPALSRPVSCFRPTLVKASMRQPSRSLSPAVARSITHREPREDHTATLSRIQQTPPAVVLIRWQRTDGSGAKSVYTRALWTLNANPTSSFTYAAVPTRTGWLIIQL